MTNDNAAENAVWSALDNEADTATVDEVLAFVHYQRAWDNRHVYADTFGVSYYDFQQAWFENIGTGYTDPKDILPAPCAGACGCSNVAMGHRPDCRMAW